MERNPPDVHPEVNKGLAAFPLRKAAAERLRQQSYAESALKFNYGT
jgi:hypothetical protein